MHYVIFIVIVQAAWWANKMYCMILKSVPKMVASPLKDAGLGLNEIFFHKKLYTVMALTKCLYISVGAVKKL